MFKNGLSQLFIWSKMRKICKPLSIAFITVDQKVVTKIKFPSILPRFLWDGICFFLSPKSWSYIWKEHSTLPIFSKNWSRILFSILIEAITSSWNNGNNYVLCIRWDLPRFSNSVDRSNSFANNNKETESECKTVLKPNKLPFYADIKTAFVTFSQQYRLIGII